MGDAPTNSSFSTLDAPPSGDVGGAGNAGAATPTGSVNDLFAKLKEFQWKGIAFPSAEDDVEIRQDLVIHRFADRNGGYAENTGRHPIQITARIPFLNQIYPGGKESWPAGALYPYQWRLFIAACLDGTSGTLQHPELGPLNCKIEIGKTTWSGKVRGGVWVQATWIESDDTQANDVGNDLSNATPQALLVTSSSDLDATIATLQAAVTAQQNPLPPFQFSFDDLANFVIGVIDIPTLMQKENQGRIGNLIYQADRVQDAVQESPLFGPMLWPMFQAATRIKDAAYNAALAPAIAGGKPILTKQIAKDSTLAQAALFVGSDITSFIVLNYALVSVPVLPAGTTVRYYADAA